MNYKKIVGTTRINRFKVGRRTNISSVWSVQLFTFDEAIIFFTYVMRLRVYRMIGNYYEFLFY